jgi:hypothetical protein
MKVADDFPAGTSTDAGTAADVRSLDSATSNPPTGAGSRSVIVPVTLPPAVTGFGVSEIAEGTTARTVSMSCADVAFTCAAIRSTLVRFVARVVTGTDTLFAPEGTITVDGINVPEPSVVISIFNPPTGAGPVIVRSNFDAVPPRTEFGVKTAVAIDARFTINFVLKDSVSLLAEM